MAPSGAPCARRSDVELGPCELAWSVSAVRVPSNKRLRLAARRDYGMNLFWRAAA